MIRLELVLLVLIAAAGSIAAYYGYELGLTQFGKPGAGLFPFIIGIALPLLCAPLLVQRLVVPADPTGSEVIEGSRTHWRAEAAVYLALAAYVVTLPYLGFAIGSLLLVFFLVRFIAGKPWIASGLMAVVVVAPLVVILGKVLKVSLPQSSLF